MNGYAERPRMSRSQRILVFVSALVLAWMLHVLLCNWVVRAPARSASRIVAYDHGQFPIPGIVNPLSHYTGLFASDRDGRNFAIVFGVVVPLALLCVDGYLLLGWRRAARLERGRCPKCGYDLRGKHDAGCPECGWNRAAEHASRGDAV